MNKVLRSIYPEMDAGGYHRYNARAAFFTRIRALLPDDAHVLDFGAGRGKYSVLENEGLRRITDIRDRCDRFAAFDVDEAVRDNPETEDRHFAPIGEPLPFADESFDLIYSWMVFEHVADPEFYAAELERILKPGGWICAGTPNKWGVVGMGARAIPNSLHVKLLRLFSPNRAEEDTFPTAYRLNTRRDLRTHFPPDRFDHYSFFMFTGPAYHANRVALARFWQFVNILLPPGMKQNFQIFIQKRDRA